MIEVAVAYLFLVVVLASLTSAAVEVVKKTLPLQGLFLRLALTRLFRQLDLRRKAATDGSGSEAGERPTFRQWFRDLEGLYDRPDANPARTHWGWVADIPPAALHQYIQDTCGEPDWRRFGGGAEAFWVSLDEALRKGFRLWVLVLSFVIGTLMCWGLRVDAVGLGTHLAQHPSWGEAISRQAEGAAPQLPSDAPRRFLASLEDCVALALGAPRGADGTACPEGGAGRLSAEADRLRLAAIMETVGRAVETAGDTSPSQAWQTALFTLEELGQPLPGDVSPAEVIGAGRAAVARTDGAFVDLFRAGMALRLGAGDGLPEPVMAGSLAWLLRRAGGGSGPDRTGTESWDIQRPAVADWLAGAEAARLSLLDRAAMEAARTGLPAAHRATAEVFRERVGFAGVEQSPEPWLRWLGYAVMGIFIAAGAPFWFEIIRQLTAVRKGQVPPPLSTGQV